MAQFFDGTGSRLMGLDTLWRARRALRRLGVDLRRYGEQDADFRLWRAIERHRIDTLIDVGANRGQFARYMRAQGFAGRILSVEPGPAMFAALEAAARTDGRWSAHRLALSRGKGRMALAIGANDQTSSLRTALTAGDRLGRELAVVSRAEVDVDTLPGFVAAEGVEPRRALLKLDVQGSERDVLEGAGAMLDAFPLMLVECAVVPIYDGDFTFAELVAFARARGFGVVGLKGGYFSPDNGEMLQVDVLLERVRADG